MTLASVCRLWRAVALSTPRLWTLLDPGHRYTDLKRDNPRHGAQLLPCAENFRLLAEHSTQLRVLDLFGRDGIRIDPIGWLGTFPSLFKISLSTSWDMITLPSLLNAPQLREASFRRSEFPADFDWQSSLPWNQLTVLRGFQQEIPAWLKILEHTPNLELLEFFYAEELSIGVTASTPPVLLPHLRTLILRGRLSHKIIPFLTLPALLAFHLEEAIGFCIDKVEALIQRSAFALADLYLSVDDSDMDALYHCLRALPTVRNFEINCRHIADEGDTVQELLCLMDGTSPFSPRCRLWRSAIVGHSLSFIERDHNPRGDPDGRHRPVADLLGDLRKMRSGGLRVDIQSSVNWFSDELNTSMIREICGEF
ncbi:hypothetical protein FB45DRAFT_866655 [Roridomyces roridus]|uniref:F-box domain-containing protein n=1 Tax=Roridomyces roridus TaxID=1738132 RepID=A0AAD7BXW3_9AGAR|nr:hypothetical protein FB45DRAFT_866655 [Roridomyces roridus]